MRYFGGKIRVASSLSKYLNEQLQGDQCFVDLFCGSCNVISKIDPKRKRIANDKHKYLIEMWKGLQNGYELPKELSREEYEYIKNHKDEDPCLTGFVGFGCSFSGKWFGGYAKDNTNRNYCLNGKNTTEKKLEFLQDVEFLCEDYSEVDIPEGAMVYCDIPYKDTTQYDKKEVGVFDWEGFIQWVRDNSDKYDIYVSEYSKNVPEDFTIVWSMASKKDIRNGENKKEPTVEVLMKYKG